MSEKNDQFFAKCREIGLTIEQQMALLPALLEFELTTLNEAHATAQRVLRETVLRLAPSPLPLTDEVGKLVAAI